MSMPRRSANVHDTLTRSATDETSCVPSCAGGAPSAAIRRVAIGIPSEVSDTTGRLRARRLEKLQNLEMVLPCG
eukprot:4564794-Prymnesium_polylepis.1